MHRQKQRVTLQTLLFLIAAALFLVATRAALDLKSTMYTVLFIITTTVYATYTILSFFGKV